MDQNALAYFLYLLGGFAFVWAYRKAAGKKERLGEFEYASWSSIFGLGIYLIFQDMVNKNDSTLWAEIVKNPENGTPSVVIIGLFFGVILGLQRRMLPWLNRELLPSHPLGITGKIKDLFFGLIKCIEEKLNIKLY